MTDVWEMTPRARLRGEVRIPGDKSMAHRALMLASIAEGVSRVSNLPDGADVHATAECMRALGVSVRWEGPDATILGAGLRGLRAPTAALDCGNSGTSMRLLAGLVAGQPFATTLDGDHSLRARPMARVAEPLRAMGARVVLAEGDRAPMAVRGGRLRGVTYRPPVASAQIKSCVLLAGLYADGATAVIEPRRSRDHTERLLAALGVDIEIDGEAIVLTPPGAIGPLSGAVPGDASSAAYWLVAASLAADGDVTLPYVGLNPTRVAIVDLLRSWGARIDAEPGADWHGEPTGSLRVRSASRPLRGGRIEAAAVPTLIDELPLLALLGPLTEEGVEIRGAAELRVKESDRIASSAAALRAFGASVDEYPDGLAVRGATGLRGGTVEAVDDHRIALAAAAVSVAADATVTIQGAEAAAVSYPGFRAALEAAAR